MSSDIPALTEQFTIHYTPIYNTSITGTPEHTLQIHRDLSAAESASYMPIPQNHHPITTYKN